MSNSDAFAVVDLGTNTFHLLIARYVNDGLEIIYRERHFVKLAAEGIKQIGDASAERALVAVTSIGTSLARYTLKNAQAFGTAALRTASNGPALRTSLSKALGLDIQLIDGQREAALIAKGVTASHPPSSNYLIMDIGGGSVEFIVVDHGRVGFSESYPIGAQVLKQRFHMLEPFGKTQHDALNQQLETTLEHLLNHVPQPLTLVGASGTFDVLAALYGTSLSPLITEVPGKSVSALFHEVVHMDESARFADPRIPDDRADMIVVALGLIEFFVNKFPSLRILTSEYALKEGALVEMATSLEV